MVEYWKFFGAGAFIILVLGFIFYVIPQITQGEENSRLRLACEDGCINADFILYGKANRTGPSEMYGECADQCWEMFGGIG